MKIAYFDLETTDLNPEFGRLLCGSILSLPTEEMITFRQDSFLRRKKAKSMTDDRELAIAIRDCLESHNLYAGWYTKGFDVSFLNSRLAAHGERLLKRLFHIDGVWYVKGWRGIKAKTGRLEDVANFLGVKEKKMKLDAKTWLEARQGDKAAMDVVSSRCESDVRLARAVIERLMDDGMVQRIERYP